MSKKFNFDEEGIPGTPGKGISRQHREQIKSKLNAIRKIIKNNHTPSEDQKDEVCNYLCEDDDLRNSYQDLWDECQCPRC